MVGNEQAWRKKTERISCLTPMASDPDSISAITREAVLCVLTARDAYHADILWCRTFGLATATVASLLALMLFHCAPLIAFTLRELASQRHIDTIDSILQQEISLAAVTIRNLPDETHRALKLRAAQHGRSTEAEIRALLEEAVRPKVRLGTALRAVGRSLGGVELKLERDRTPVAGAVLR